MGDYGEDVTPFWLQTTGNGLDRCRRFFFNTGVLLILLLAIAFAFFFIVIISSFLSFTSNIFRPQGLKNTCDSLNLALVLFAVICAFLNKSNGGDGTPRSIGDYEFSSTHDRASSAENGCRRFFFDTGVFIILSLVIAFGLISIVIPSFLCFTSNIFKNQFVKKTWDSLNLVIVLFAVICGFLNRRNGGDETPRSCRGCKFCSTSEPVRRSNSSSSGQWYYDRTAYGGGLRRMRSSSSYPDLRRVSTWDMNGGDRRRFNDDSGLYDYRSRSRRELNENDIAVDTVRTMNPSPPPPPPPYQVPVPPPIATKIEPSAPPAPEFLLSQPEWTYEDVPPRERSQRGKVVYSELKNKHSLPSPPPPPLPPPYQAPIEPSAPPAPDELLLWQPPHDVRTRRKPEWTYEDLPSPPLPPYQAPVPPAVPSAPPATELPPWQQPRVVRRKPELTYEDVPLRERNEREVVYKDKHSLLLPPLSAVPPSPPLPVPPPPPPQPIVDPKRRGNKNEKKRGGLTKEILKVFRRKKKKQTQRSVGNLDEFFNLATLSSYPPSPPPPPPPPSFYNVFSSKKNKAKKQQSVPPPPPPRASKREPNKPPITIKELPLPINIRNDKNVEECMDNGNKSPFSSILPPPPPPPPPPPFNMPAARKFEAHSDFVRSKNINVSQSGSPDLDDPLSGSRNIQNVEEYTDSGSDSPFNSIPPPPPPFNMPTRNHGVHVDFIRSNSINGSRSGSSDSDDPLSGSRSIKNVEEYTDSGSESPFNPIPPPPPPPFNMPMRNHGGHVYFVRSDSINGSRSGSSIQITH
ncbi:hypothetical protein V6N13_023759 [Hibiscus sabdariffa]|uniref:Uncharacterized protein n=1 Tax=Hibiscus sabdariffa TaxID=183260 RepID=A0ABR2PMQ5_9ROSI